MNWVTRRGKKVSEGRFSGDDGAKNDAELQEGDELETSEDEGWDDSPDSVFGGDKPSNSKGKYSQSKGEESGTGGPSQKSPIAEFNRPPALEVPVEHSVEKAMKILKRRLIKEGLFKELKMRRYYEKPSVRKKRKMKESMKKVRKEEARIRKSALL